jgi:hypothetical protein
MMTTTIKTSYWQKHSLKKQVLIEGGEAQW